MADIRAGLAAGVDAALEATIAGSFTRIGYAARRRLNNWDDEILPDAAGRVFVVTGATSGLGLATARDLARSGGRVLIVGRNQEKTERVADQLRVETGNTSVSVALADMGELSAVRALATDITERFDRIDALIHNAGALTADRRTNRDGLELTVASQVVGPFLLTRLLLPLLAATPESRVITVASGGMYSQPLDVSNLVLAEDEYDGTIAYAKAKRAQVALNEEWAEREDGTGVTFHAMHPGWADTPGVVDALPTFHKVVGRALRTPEEGADTIVWLARSRVPLESNGRFWLDRKPRATAYLPKTRMSDEAKRALWEWCEEMSDEQG